MDTDGRNAVEDPFRTLNVSVDAEIEVIRAAYRALAKKYHPDANPGASKAELHKRMVMINNAYDELELDLKGWRAKVRAGRANPTSIASSCPNCGRAFTTSLPGNVVCGTCKWHFAIDSKGRITQGMVVCTVCPSCRQDVKVANGGDVDCPVCDWQFEVDSRGAVLDGVPIDAVCPHCKDEISTYPAGDSSCPACGFTFYIDVLGRTFPCRA